MTALVRDRTVSRREFLGGALGVMATPALVGGQPPSSGRAVIQIVLVGGPSQLDTWDPKPDAPSEIRGPFRTIATRWPGVRISELFPMLAQRLDRVGLIRSVFHDGAPIHEIGLQRIQPRAELVLPGPIGETGVNLPRGQENVVVGQLLDQGNCRPFGNNPFGRSLASALDAVERGARHVVVNMFETVFGQVSWDVHGSGGNLPTTFSDYGRTVCPTFDSQFCTLLDVLKESGLLDDVMVVAAGEFGRTPKLNIHGGRDHWPGVWSALVAGGGFPCGVIGRTDRWGAEPDTDALPAENLATLIADYVAGKNGFAIKSS